MADSKSTYITGVIEDRHTPPTKARYQSCFMADSKNRKKKLRLAFYCAAVLFAPVPVVDFACASTVYDTVNGSPVVV